MHKLPILEAFNLSFYLICPYAPSKENPINLMDDKDDYQVELSTGDITIAIISVDDFLGLCHSIAVTRLTFGLASGKFCRECVEVLLPSVLPNLHAAHSRNGIETLEDSIIH